MSNAPFKLLLDGHDTVECCYYLQAPAGKGLDFERLAALREALRQGKSKDPRPITLDGVEFLLQRYGSSRGFPLVLSNADLSIECGEFNDPSFYVIYRSEALWRESAFALHERFCEWAKSLGFGEYRPETLSRVDWTFDYHLPVIDFDEDRRGSIHRQGSAAQEQLYRPGARCWTNRNSRYCRSSQFCTGMAPRSGLKLGTCGLKHPWVCIGSVGYST